MSATSMVTERTDGAPPVWLLVLKQELAELWLGGRALSLTILFSVLLSVTAFLMATNNELNLTPPSEIETIMLQAVMTFGLFIGLIISAESISGERERSTLEALLLATTSRREIVAGKYLAALSPWLAAMVLAVPYMLVLSQQDPVVFPAMLWGALLGTLLALTFTGVGMIVSILSNSGRTSLFVSLLFYLASLLPTQLPGEVQASVFGRMMQLAGPLEAARQYLHNTLVIGSPIESEWHLLAACIASAVLVVGLLFVRIAPGLNFEGGLANLSRPAPRDMEKS
jgi:ABC-type Na+ efflux pump permease subunit